ncbi:MAG: polyphosphate kinase 1 [Anaerolineaceae bacterium]|nr:polyphosphate kinase 1 [Anaerolineaceae bacterium]
MSYPRTEAMNSRTKTGAIRLSPENYLNREAATLAFQRRVLALAQDAEIPLLERVKFASIVGSNLDEFFMVRVGTYQQRQNLGLANTRPDGLFPEQVLAHISEEAGAIIQELRATLNEIFVDLAKYDIQLITPAALDEETTVLLRSYFQEEVFPVLTPLAVDHARPFPFISNLSMNLGVLLRHDDGDDDEPLQFVRIKVPPFIPRLLDVNEILRRQDHPNIPPGYRYLWLEDLIANNLDQLFPGMKIVEHYPFRVVRNTDIDYEYEREESELNISNIIEASLLERRFGSITRLGVPSDISESMLARLRSDLQIDNVRDVYYINGALGSASLHDMTTLDLPELRYPPHTPRIAESLQEQTQLFDTIRRGDILLFHPYDSFAPVEDFFRQAAVDPQVVAIKTTLYRVGNNSPVVQALMDARDNDKQVSVLVELKARFDEENNLIWTRALENKGVHVIYGVEELPVKTHSKVTMVVRREGNLLRRYIHLSSGNYNSSTARIYSDIGLFTCHQGLAEDVSRLFNRLTGFAPSTQYQHLWVAPEYLLPALLERIDGEIAAAESGKPAYIILKANQLEEDRIIERLYQASAAGVKVDLIIRGFSTLKCGIPKLSENIRQISILGRFLEHSRIFYFHSAPADQRIYIGSADLMRRNLYNRVETVFPILDTNVQQQVLRILATQMADNTLAWEMGADGNFQRRQLQESEEAVNSQDIFLRNSSGLDQLPRFLAETGNGIHP